MIDKFLKAKHWQLFLLTYGIPMVIQFAFIGSFMVDLNNGDGVDGDSFASLFSVMMGSSLLFMSIFFGWFWSLGVGLHKKAPEHLRINLNRFKLFLFIPIAYLVFIFFFLFPIFSGTAVNETLSTFPRVILWIIPLHLFSMFCIFHSLYQVAKTIKLAELQREVSFSDFAGEFFLIWFFPIGIWFVQPKVNKLVEGRVSNENELV